MRLAAEIDHLRALVERDRSLEQEARAIQQLEERTGDVRARAAAVVAAYASLPAEREQNAQARAAAADRIATAERDHAVALAGVEKAASSRRDRADRLAEAEADELVARETLADAVALGERLERERVALDEREQRLRDERRALGAEAASLAATVAGTRRVAGAAPTDVPAELELLDEWGVRARAALFVARGSVVAERERVVAEANAVASAALGEDVGALSVELVLRRLQAAGAA